MDGWTKGRMDGRMDGWTQGLMMHGLMFRRMMDGRTDVWADRRMDEPRDTWKTRPAASSYKSM